MITSNVVKKWLKAEFGLKVRATTTSTVQKWIMVRIVPSRHEPAKGVLEYDSEFPKEFGTFCLRVIYGQDTTITFPAGNVDKHSVSMTEKQWATVLETWT